MRYFVVDNMISNPADSVEQIAVAEVPKICYAAKCLDLVRGVWCDCFISDLAPPLHGLRVSPSVVVGCALAEFRFGCSDLCRVGRCPRQHPFRCLKCTMFLASHDIRPIVTLHSRGPSTSPCSAPLSLGIGLTMVFYTGETVSCFQQVTA